MCYYKCIYSVYVYVFIFVKYSVNIYLIYINQRSKKHLSSWTFIFRFINSITWFDSSKFNQEIRIKIFEYNFFFQRFRVYIWTSCSLCDAIEQLSEENEFFFLLVKCILDFNCIFIKYIFKSVCLCVLTVWK